ncbi:MAG: DinB family protein [Anaerolineae bacterium]|jgi:uncharacterized damage-inducible protein DinB|nr:DinB family protein [Anaerolineae bacterium]
MTPRTLNARYQMLIEALDGTPRDLQRLTRRVDDAAALIRPAPGAWCIKDVIAHLAEVEEQFRARFVCIVEQDDPCEPSVHPDSGQHDLGRDLRELIALFAARRASTTAYLRALDHRQWLRTCVHQVHGRIKLRKQVEFLIGHDNEHLAQIVRIRECIEKA